MNKQVIATILGTALLGFSNKGSKSKKSNWKKFLFGKKIYASFECPIQILATKNSENLEYFNKLKEWFSRPDAEKDISESMMVLMQKYKRFYEIAYASLDYYENGEDIEESRIAFIEAGFGDAAEFADDKFNEEFVEYYYPEEGYEKMLPLRSTRSQSTLGEPRLNMHNYYSFGENTEESKTVLDSLNSIKKIDVFSKRSEIEIREHPYNIKFYMPLKFYVEYDFDAIASFLILWLKPNIHNHIQLFKKLDLEQIMETRFAFFLAELMADLKIDTVLNYKKGFTTRPMGDEWRCDFGQPHSVTVFPHPLNIFNKKRFNLRRR